MDNTPNLVGIVPHLQLNAPNIEKLHSLFYFVIDFQDAALDEIKAVKLFFFLNACTVVLHPAYNFFSKFG